MEILHRKGTDETLWRKGDTLVLEFLNERKICSTSPLNEGIAEGIKILLNQTTPKVETASDLPGGSVKNYLVEIANGLGFNSWQASGLLTAAKQRNAAFATYSFRKLEVLAVATAGVDQNGGCAGDPASYYEKEGQFEIFPGTINILLSINANLPPAAMIKGVITATEAKTSILSELLAPSHYSKEIATGSGTDGVILAVDPNSKCYLTDTGLHSKLGELIGLAVRRAVKNALALETGLTADRQLDVLARLNRFKIDENHLWLDFQSKLRGKMSKKDYLATLNIIAKNPELVAIVSLLMHLMDQIRWGLLPEETSIKLAFQILEIKLGCERTRLIKEIYQGGGTFEQIFIRFLNVLVQEQAMKKVK